MKHTPLHALHLALGARMVPFAGYEMPVQYPQGIVREHLHTRSAASLFDVSHMGQVLVRGPGVAEALERLLPADLLGLPVGRQSYSLFTNEQAGVLDDLIVTRWDAETLFLVVNAACKEADLAYLRAGLPGGLEVRELCGQGLLALQGPQAATVLCGLVPALAQLVFMSGMHCVIEGAPCFVTRSGYTGEDGFEISLPEEHTERIARLLLGHDTVAPAGLGARDSLRLEAGLCLYGHELGPRITVIEAGLGWAIPLVRRAGGARAGGYPGAQRVDAELHAGTARRRVGLRGNERVPVREGGRADRRGRRLRGRSQQRRFRPQRGRPRDDGFSSTAAWLSPAPRCLPWCASVRERSRWRSCRSFHCAITVAEQRRDHVLDHLLRGQAVAGDSYVGMTPV
jgi:aminomethyltransferase